MSNAPIQTSVTQISVSRLPAALDQLIGRNRDLERAERYFQEGFERLITVIGTGGTGKTRFALELARRLEPGFAQGCVFVDLSALRDTNGLNQEITRALWDNTSGSYAPSLESLLQDQDLLLVLDNLEQIHGIAEAVLVLLEGYPRLHLIATSRITLNIRGERRFTLAPLAPHYAQALFLERTRAIAPEFVAPEQEVLLLCARLDGLPLALELAAARMNAFTPQGLLDYLEHAPLTSRRTGPQRQHSLDALLEWSYSLLEHQERDWLRSLGVFAGSFGLRDAAGVLGTTLNLEGLFTLQEHSLIVAIPGVIPRFRLLETVRDFALNRLQRSGEREVICARHAAYYTQQLEPWQDGIGGPKHVENLVWLDNEHLQLRAALKWTLEDLKSPERLDMAITLYSCILEHLQRREGVAQMLDFTEILLKNLPTHHKHLAKISNYMGWILYDLGENDRALSCHTLALEESIFWGNLKVQAEAYHYFSNIYLDIFKYQECVECAQKALILLSKLKEDNLKSPVLNNLAMAQTRLGQFELARETYQEALIIANLRADPLEIATVLNNSAFLEMRMGQLDTAVALYAQSLHFQEFLGEESGMGILLINYGETQIKRGKNEQALELLERALKITEVSKHRTHTPRMVRIRVGLAEIALNRGQWEAAQSHLHQALSQIPGTQGKNLLFAAACHVCAKLAMQRQMAPLAQFWLELGDRMSPAPPLIRVTLYPGEREALEGWLKQRRFEILPLPEVITMDFLEQMWRGFEENETSIKTSPAPVAPSALSPDSIGSIPSIHFTAREHDLLMGLARGDSNKHIAQRLKLSEGSVRIYLVTIYSKLEVKSRAQAMLRMTELGIGLPK